MSIDIDDLRTFLEVNQTRHFGKAANNLFITQSAVSARIRLLESTLGAPLFTRKRDNIQLTSTGQRLLKHAENILLSWNRARQEVAAKEEELSICAVAGLPSLWDIYIQRWLLAVFSSRNDLMMNIDLLGADALLRMLLDGTLDVIFLFESPQNSEIETVEILRIPLILVSTEENYSVEKATSENYILVDWGTSFSIDHARHFPDIPIPLLRVGQGRMALDFILEHGGSAFLAEQMVSEYLDNGMLHKVSNAPIIERSACAVFSIHNEKKSLIEELVKLVP